MTAPIVRLRNLQVSSGSSATALALGLALMASPALAQDAAAAAAAPQQAEAAPEEAIVVTGSRIARSGFDQPTPVTMINAEQMQRQAVTNISQSLNDLPSFRPQSTPATTAIFVSNLGAATADLRGLGANRTLVLIDGRRVVPATVAGGSFTPGGTVDLNLIPTSLVQRAEVVTGGASAAYGSDAVAGVVNLILDTKFSGIRGSAQYGLAEAGDNKEYQLSLAVGTGFADSRGHIVVGAEYSDSKGVGDCYTRDWCAAGSGTISNPLVSGSTTQRVAAGQPATIFLPNPRTATASMAGLITAGPLRGTEFNTSGTTFAHNYGTFYNAGLFQSGGGDPVMAYYENFPIVSPTERLNIFGHGEFELGDAVTLFAEGSYGRVHGTIIGAQRRDTAITIRRDNAFLPTTVATRMDSLGLTSFNMGRIWDDIGPQVGTVTRSTSRAVFGAKIRMWGDWTMDAYYQYGQTNYHQIGRNTTITPRMTFALDSVLVNGVATCRGVRDNVAAAAGCQPLNPFGNGSVQTTPAGVAYVTGTATQDSKLTQNVVSAAGQGTLFQGWAGPIKLATGLEFRQDIARGTADPISTALQFYTSPGAAISGKVDVFEAFGELSVPLFKGAELNGALRTTDYSTTGAVTTWKIGADYAPLPWLRLRGTRSRDIRAPSIFELYGPRSTSFQTVIPATSPGGQVLASVLLGGNDKLVPEVADTWTVGVVLQPDFGSAGRPRLSVDYYDIQLNNAVSQLGAQVIADGCEKNKNPELCALVTYDGTGKIAQIVNLNINLGSLITRGWDVEASYTLPMTVFGGQISWRGLATIVDDLITVSASGTVDRAGMNGAPTSQPSGVPRYIINSYLTYTSDRVTAQVQVRHLSGGIYNVTSIGPGQAGYDPALANSVNDNLIGSATYVNLNASVAVWKKDDRKLEIFGAVSNLLDRDPANNTPSSFGPANNVLYDVIGRSYRVGARFKF
ncbi:TonB-dependent receptor domain-containing protein [Sphingobium nicotianae]|uniref:TonB-dependent receptor n=1 Tax=Sphingobium nicotianae TaxID=2782607 RepID=A0A9X1DCF0_9SPHN|nr:TonB-dependent receptor [Sphingobium nicotianae]MBT2187386.1 TonB-dependent receptor [Sphingobium nicotianae]